MMRSRQDRGGGPNDSGSGHGYPQTEGCNLDTTTNYLGRLHLHNLHPGENLLPGAKLHPGANLHHLVSRSYDNKLCSYVPIFDLKFKQGTQFLEEIRCVEMFGVTVTLCPIWV